MKTDEGLWKLSPSGLYDYRDCKRCFWIKQHIGRVPGPPWRLNDAVDSKLKVRYDEHRRSGTLPPEIKHLKDVSLFADQDLINQWRNWQSGLSFENKKDRYKLGGAIDDLLVSQDGKHIPIDFKASGDPPKESKKDYYIPQLHAYALMLRENKYPSADKAYLVHYYTKDRKDPSLNMEFAVALDEISLDLSSFEQELRDVVKLLEGPIPSPSVRYGQDRNRCLCDWLQKYGEL